MQRSCEQNCAQRQSGVVHRTLTSAEVGGSAVQAAAAAALVTFGWRVAGVAVTLTERVAYAMTVTVRTLAHIQPRYVHALLVLAQLQENTNLTSNVFT